jgi:hypothetical protein
MRLSSPVFRARRARLFLIVTTVFCACLATGFSQRAIASSETKVPRKVEAIPSTKVACLIKGTHRYVGRYELNGRCEIGGLVESSFSHYHGFWERLGLGGTFARFPIKGKPINGSAWTEWGAPKSRGIGKNTRNGHDMNLSLYRRIRCADGSTWYSKADVSDTQTAVVYYLRLPVCGDSVPGGRLGTR